MKSDRIINVLVLFWGSEGRCVKEIFYFFFLRDREYMRGFDGLGEFFVEIVVKMG